MIYQRYLFGIAVGLLLAATSVSSYGQYGMGGMGGYGRGYGGRMNNGMSQGMTSTPTRVIPNIAGDMATKETKWLKENLNLSKDQQKAVKQLNNEYASQQQDAIKDIIGKSEKPTPEIRKQIQDMMLMLNEEKEDKLKPILTPEQWTTYQAKKGDMQKEIGGYRPPASRVDSTAKTSGQP